jgi:hypothetical protein
MVKIPIKQIPTVMKQAVSFDEIEEFEVKPNVSKNSSGGDGGGRDWKGKFNFVAPSFAEMMIDIKKLEATLLAIEKGHEAILPGESAISSEQLDVISPALDRASVIALDEFRQTEFYLYAPMADAVQLVADFTQWQKFPLDMVKSEGGTWCIVIPLPAGQYDYAFIVDGIWQNDSQLRSMLVGSAPRFSSKWAAA